jgi:coproporphyrinogen III oxidase
MRIFLINTETKHEGVGGLFFDYLKEEGSFSLKDRYDFVTAVGNSFLEGLYSHFKKTQGSCTILLLSVIGKKLEEGVM